MRVNLYFVSEIFCLKDTCISEFGSDVLCYCTTHLKICDLLHLTEPAAELVQYTYKACHLQNNVRIACCRALIAGGGAPETELGLKLAHYAQTITGVDAYCFRLVFPM
jgi:hypothetical protein